MIMFFKRLMISFYFRCDPVAITDWFSFYIINDIFVFYVITAYTIHILRFNKTKKNSGIKQSSTIRKSYGNHSLHIHNSSSHLRQFIDTFHDPTISNSNVCSWILDISMVFSCLGGSNIPKLAVSEWSCNGNHQLFQCLRSVR